jgi:hypothetical protein
MFGESRSIRQISQCVVVRHMGDALVGALPLESVVPWWRARPSLGSAVYRLWRDGRAAPMILPGDGR